MIDDKNKEFINARRATKELETLQRSLLKSAPATPPTGSSEERKQVSSKKSFFENF